MALKNIRCHAKISLQVLEPEVMFSNITCATACKHSIC